MHDVADHLDRVIELVNRTNQLNFTKIRLPEDVAQARAQLAEELASFRWQVGLVRVIDTYGDYGFCGFYAYNILARRLDHFCFSCRTLGMGVESWLYARLGRPSIKVRGEVLTDLHQQETIDWITFAAASADNEPLPQTPLGTVYLRGSCDLAAVGHYLGLVSKDIIQDFNVSYNGLNLRLDHSMFIRYALRPPGDHAREALASVGYPAELCQSLLPQSARAADLFVLSFRADMSVLYRHRETGLLTPFSVPGFNNVHDATGLAAETDKYFGTPNGQASFRALCENFDCAGVITEADFKENVRLALDIIPGDKPVVIILGLEPRRKAAGAEAEAGAALNDWTRDVAAGYANVTLIDLADCITGPADLRGTIHFDRAVYMRLYERVVAAAKAFPQGQRAAA